MTTFKAALNAWGKDFHSASLLPKNIRANQIITTQTAMIEELRGGALMETLKPLQKQGYNADFLDAITETLAATDPETRIL